MSDENERHIKLDVGFYEVTVRDDEADLDELEAVANRVADRAKADVEELGDETDPGGMHR